MRDRFAVLAALTRLFFSRFFDKEALSPQGDPQANVIQTLSILAAPGAFVALLFCLLPVSTTGWNLVALRCLFLTVSMPVMGFIVVFEWNALFLDHRDYQVLLPLPIPFWALFAAKAAALCWFLALFLVDLNVFASLFWPSIENGNIFGVVAVHWLVMVAAGLFSALAVVAIQGVLLTVIPSRILRPVAASAQTILVMALVMLFFIAPLISSGLQALVRERNPLLQYVPAFWFAGLYEKLRPAVANRTLMALGAKTIPAIGYAIALVLLTHLPLYRRHARKLLETIPRSPAGPGRIRTACNTLLNTVVVRPPVQQAVFYFIGQTIGRSMKHRLFLGTYAGFGLALVAIRCSGEREDLLQIPLILSFVLISGLRAAFNFPSELGANWAIQMCDTGRSRDCLVATRKWILLYGIAPLFVLLGTAGLLFFSWNFVLFQMLFGLTLSLLLLEILFFSFRKIPFTCGYFPAKTSLVPLVVVYITGFTVYSSVMAGLEVWLIARPVIAAAALCAAVCVSSLLWIKGGSAGTHLDYLNEGDPEVRGLGLTA